MLSKPFHVLNVDEPTMPMAGSYMNEITFFCKENGEPVNEKVPLTIDIHGITSFEENLYKVGELHLNLA